MADDEVLTLDTIKFAGLELTTPSAIDYTNTLIYGDSGVGKTRLAASAALVADCAPVLLIDIEKGGTSARGFSNIYTVRPTSFTELANVGRELKKQQTNGGIQYKTIIVDSLTEAQRLGTDAVMARTVERAREKGETKDPDHPDWGDWTKSHNTFRRLVRSFRDLECNVIFTALAQVDNSRPSKPKAKPKLNGAMADEIAASLDFVFYMFTQTDDEAKEVRRGILTSSTEDIISKDRSGNLDRTIADPTWEIIYNQIIGDNNE